MNENNGYFTGRHANIYDNISLNSSQNEKYFRKTVVDGIKTYNLHSMVSSIFFFPKTAPFV